MLTKYLKTRKKNKKLDSIKIKPFFINAKKEIISYKLELHKNIKVYHIFYILLLELTDFKTYIYNTFYYQILKKNEFEVKKIQN